MTSRDAARTHLRKARQFLDAASVSRDLGLLDAATSAAVIAGVNAKDAICLSVVGRTNKADDHTATVAELRSSGPAGRALAPVLSRLLRLKTTSQYQAVSVSATDAGKAIEWATRLVDAAHEEVTSR